ncbi:MAG: flagellar FliJ family protein [Spirochaetales bacterium]|nr:flagellar FliJ family protein [Spirochaetales bacterium]
MKKFKFELEKILEYRNYEKKAAEGELAKALAVEAQINAQLEAIALKLVQMNKSMKTSYNFNDIIAQSQHTNLLNYQKEELLKQLAQAKLVTEQKRSVLRECMKKTTALEKLKEKQLADWKAAADYEEAELLDEVKNKL